MLQLLVDLLELTEWLVAPASMKTVAGISIGFDEDLIMRAASVMLKEQRKLIFSSKRNAAIPNSSGKSY